jgi:hypothetical protein
MKNKLTEYQVENIIENIVKKNEDSKVENFKKHYIKKLKECDNKKETFRVLDELYSMQTKFINEGYNEKYVNENMLKDIFSLGLSGGWQSVKEYIYRKLLSSISKFLGIQSNPEMIRAMSIGLSNIDFTENWRKFLSPVKNCEFFAEAIVTGLVEYYLAKKVSEVIPDSVFGSTVRNSVIEFLRTNKSSKEFQGEIYGKICDGIRSAFSSGKLTDMIKQKFGGVAGGETPTTAPAV